jgi:hypothetical protein
MSHVTVWGYTNMLRLQKFSTHSLHHVKSAQHGVLMNSSVHFGKNEGSPSFVGARGRLDSHR